MLEKIKIFLLVKKRSIFIIQLLMKTKTLWAVSCHSKLTNLKIYRKAQKMFFGGCLCNSFAEHPKIINIFFHKSKYANLKSGGEWGLLPNQRFYRDWCCRPSNYHNNGFSTKSSTDDFANLWHTVNSPDISCTKHQLCTREYIHISLCPS